MSIPGKPETGFPSEWRRYKRSSVGADTHSTGRGAYASFAIDFLNWARCLLCASIIFSRYWP